MPSYLARLGAHLAVQYSFSVGGMQATCPAASRAFPVFALVSSRSGFCPFSIAPAMAVRSLQAHSMPVQGAHTVAGSNSSCFSTRTQVRRAFATLAVPLSARHTMKGRPHDALCWVLFSGKGFEGEGEGGCEGGKQERR